MLLEKPSCMAVSVTLQPARRSSLTGSTEATGHIDKVIRMQNALGCVPQLLAQLPCADGEIRLL